MTLPDRTGLIALLERLESEKDEDVLAAAREIAAMKKQAGTDWAAILDAVADDDDVIWDGTIDENADEAESEGDADPSDAGDDAKLIAELLARDDLSETTRQDLIDFQTEAARGPLGKSDSRYVRALHRRLIGA